MSEIMALSVVTGLLCGIWSLVSPAFGLLAWAGFAGCTTYFASGKHGLEGLFITIRQNVFGAFCGISTIFLSNKFDFVGNLLVFSGLLTFVMCIAGKFDFLSFIPGTFVGCFSAFAFDGDWKLLILTLILGAFLGVACDLGGNLLYVLNTKLIKKL